MESTTQTGGDMNRSTYNQSLIQGLWKIRNRDTPDSPFRKQTRDWLRQSVRYERHVRSQGR
jgi:hypothetical protein